MIKSQTKYWLRFIKIFKKKKIETKKENVKLGEWGKRNETVLA